MDSTILQESVDRVLHLQSCLVKGFTSWECNDDDYQYKPDKKGEKICTENCNCLLSYIPLFGSNDLNSENFSGQP